jgi:AcrR family transcriptional regulator
MKKQIFDLTSKKLPKQGRALFTWHAMLDAAAQLLIARGYHGLTTNHIAETAGVSIGTVYEYFPGKDAIVAAVATRFLDDVVIGELEKIFQNSVTLPVIEGTHYTVRAFYQLLLTEKELVRVLLLQVPFTHELDAFKNLSHTILQLVIGTNQRASPQYRVFPSAASLYLLSSMVGGTLLQLALAPPLGLSADEVLNELAEKIAEWSTAET